MEEGIDVILTKNTLVPIGIVGVLIVAGTWVGKVETTLEAHQLQLRSTPVAIEQISRDISQIREALARLEGKLEKERQK